MIYIIEAFLSTWVTGLTEHCHWALQKPWSRRSSSRKGQVSEASYRWEGNSSMYEYICGFHLIGISGLAGDESSRNMYSRIDQHWPSEGDNSTGDLVVLDICLASATVASCKHS
jgi:hypothetical protein